MTVSPAVSGAGGDGWQPVHPEVFVPLPRDVVEAIGGHERDEPRFVVHLPMAARNLACALNVAATLARSLAFLPQLDIHRTAVSEADGAGVHRVFCDRLLPGWRECVLRTGHFGPCRPEWRWSR